MRRAEETDGYLREAFDLFSAQVQAKLAVRRGANAAPLLQK